uniref:Uncharacterized protein n=1 Tax=Anguilla anguilla TaxID=7936 RepID=A0A0E9Q8M2_ANGAN
MWPRLSSISIEMRGETAGSVFLLRNLICTEAWSRWESRKDKNVFIFIFGQCFCGFRGDGEAGGFAPPGHLRFYKV